MVEEVEPRRHLRVGECCATHPAYIFVIYWHTLIHITLKLLYIVSKNKFLNTIYIYIDIIESNYYK